MFSALLALSFLASGSDDAEKRAEISSVRSDFDRNEGVVMFEKNVHVKYDKDYDLYADRVFVLLENTNQLSRIIALGHVSITNQTRSGACHVAKFIKDKNEIEMYGDGKKGKPAVITDGDGGNELRGNVIRFWTDSEQIEVEKSCITIRQRVDKELVL